MNNVLCRRTLTRSLQNTCTTLLATLLALAVMALPALNARADDVASSAMRGYFDFKQKMSEKYNLDFGFNYSLLDVHNARFESGNYNFTGQFDFYGALRLFNDAASIRWLYMDIHQIGGLTTNEYGERNGLITPVNDSDPGSLLRMLFYEHHFAAGRFMIQVGKTEPLGIFGDNRFAMDDRTRFQALPLSSIGVKDRLFSSPGAMFQWYLQDWISIGYSLNELNFSRSIPELQGAEIYSIANVSFHTGSETLGEGHYRFSWALTDAQGDYGESAGWIVSADQDLGDRWGIFFRWDGTDFQTQLNGLVSSVSGGIALRQPFGRELDTFGLGVMRTKTEKEFSAHEPGAEAYYSFGLNRHVYLTLASQIFDAARTGKTVWNLGLRLSIEL